MLPPAPAATKTFSQKNPRVINTYLRGAQDCSSASFNEVMLGGITAAWFVASPRYAAITSFATAIEAVLLRRSASELHSALSSRNVRKPIRDARRHERSSRSAFVG